MRLQGRLQRLGLNKISTEEGPNGVYKVYITVETCIVTNIYGSLTGILLLYYTDEKGTLRGYIRTQTPFEHSWDSIRQTTRTILNPSTHFLHQAGLGFGFRGLGFIGIYRGLSWTLEALHSTYCGANASIRRLTAP